MAAAKTAPEPALHDLAEQVGRAVAKAQGELADCRRRLGELRGQRELLLNKPLHRDDIAPELERHMRIKAREATQYLRESIIEMRDKTPGHVTVSPDTVACFAPLDKAWLPAVIAVLVDPADAAKRLLAAAGELPGAAAEGSPLAQRRQVIKDLDAQIAAAESHEAALIEGLQSAGVKVPLPGDPEPEPEPGERRVIGGKLQQWATFTGRDYGWWPVETEQAA